MKTGMWMQNYYRIWLVLVLSVGILLMGSLSSVQAALMLRLQSGSDIKTVADGGVGDIGVEEGMILYYGAVGSFNINVTTGLSKPIIGSLYSAELDINSVDVSGAAGSIVIWLWDDNFTLLPPPIGVPAIVAGGTTFGTVKMEGFLNENNAEFGEQTLLSSISCQGPAFSTTPLTNCPYAWTSPTAQLPSPGSTFSLTQKITITHLTASFTSFDSTFSVQTPEPGTLLLLGTGLLGFAGYEYRRRKAQKV